MSGDVWSGAPSSTSSPTRTARATTSSSWSNGRAARRPRSTSRPAAGTSRRLRDEGIEVVTADPAPGMKPDVVCRAEDLPFADGSFDVVACRTAAHHFSEVPAALAGMARVSRDRVLLVDTLNMGDDAEQAEALRDPSHVRNYTEAEWRAFVEGAGLVLEQVEQTANSMDFAAWLARTGCEGEEAERVRELWGGRVAAGRLTLDKIALKTRVAG